MPLWYDKRTLILGKAQWSILLLQFGRLLLNLVALVGFKGGTLRLEMVSFFLLSQVSHAYIPGTFALEISSNTQYFSHPLTALLSIFAWRKTLASFSQQTSHQRLLQR